MLISKTNTPSVSVPVTQNPTGRVSAVPMGVSAGTLREDVLISLWWYKHLPLNYAGVYLKGIGIQGLEIALIFPHFE